MRPHGPANVRLLAAAMNDVDRSLQPLVRDISAVYLEQISALDADCCSAGEQDGTHGEGDGGQAGCGRAYASKLGQRDIRRLLIAGAMAVIRWASRRGVPEPPANPGRFRTRGHFPSDEAAARVVRGEDIVRRHV